MMDLNTITTTPDLGTLGLGIGLTALIVVGLILTIIKGLALWKAVEKRQKGWFWVLIFINTFGILDLLYLFVFSKRK